MALERFRLDHKVALVSGGGRGIGRGVALVLAEAGADVVCAARTEAQVEAVAAEVTALGRRGVPVVCDVNDADQLDALVKRAMDELGRIDVLVNVAGGTMPAPALSVGPEAFDAAFHFNVTTAFQLCQKVVPPMRAHGDGGAIVNISSAMSHLVDSGFVAYGTAKAALSHMTRLLAHELAPRVRVNALAVGAVVTDALAPFLGGELQQKMEAMTPMGRLGTPEEIGLAVLYLASPASAWITGKVYEIDGGTVASNWPLKFSSDG